MKLVYKELHISKRLNWFNDHQKLQRPGKELMTIKNPNEIKWVYNYSCAFALKEKFSSVIFTLTQVISDASSKSEQVATCKGIIMQLK